jgi:hypothetical protein
MPDQTSTNGVVDTELKDLIYRLVRHAFTGVAAALTTHGVIRTANDATIGTVAELASGFIIYAINMIWVYYQNKNKSAAVKALSERTQELETKIIQKTPIPAPPQS